MRNIVLVIVMLVLSFQFCFSQSEDCEFHEGLSLETALIFPLPFGVIPVEDGGLGINEDATIGQPFDFKWTMIWPDSFINSLTQELAFADTLQFFLDETIWFFNDELVSIPEGLGFSITPEEGIVFPNSEEPVACIRLHGTPSENVIPGDYLMTFIANTCVTVPGIFDGCMRALIPSLASGFAGEYRLTIKADGTTSIKETLNDAVSLEVSPNPFSSQTIIKFNSSNLSSDYVLEVFDINGRKVHSENIRMKSEIQRIIFDGSELHDALYIFQLIGEEGIITGKLMLQR